MNLQQIMVAISIKNNIHVQSKVAHEGLPSKNASLWVGTTATTRMLLSWTRYLFDEYNERDSLQVRFLEENGDQVIRSFLRRHQLTPHKNLKPVS